MRPTPAACPSRNICVIIKQQEKSFPSVDTDHEHEDGVEDERHGAEGLDGRHHVPLQAQRQNDAQRDGEEQNDPETARHLQKGPA